MRPDRDCLDAIDSSRALRRRWRERRSARSQRGSRVECGLKSVQRGKRLVGGAFAAPDPTDQQADCDSGERGMNAAGEEKEPRRQGREWVEEE